MATRKTFRPAHPEVLVSGRPLRVGDTISFPWGEDADQKGPPLRVERIDNDAVFTVSQNGVVRDYSHGSVSLRAVRRDPWAAGGLQGTAEVWKLVPKSVGVLDKRTNRFVLAEVGRVVAHPPGTAPKDSPIRRDWHTVEVQTAHGTRWYGFADARITSGLRMAVLLGPGQERDEVIAKWEDGSGR